MKRLMRRPSGAGWDTVRADRHDERLRMAMKAPNMTTTTMIVPSTMVVTLGSTASRVRSVRTQAEDEDGDDRAEQSAACRRRARRRRARRPRRWRAGRARDRRADAGAHGQRQAAHRGEEPGEAHRRRSWCARRGRRCGRPRARSSRSRRSTGRAASGGAVSRRRRGRRRAGRSALGIHASIVSGMPGIGTVPTISDFSHSATPPPGASSTSSAAPCRTKSVASVTTMSGTRVTTISMPLTRAEREADAAARTARRTARYSSLAPSIIDGGGDAGQRHHRGDRQVDAAGDDDDGLRGDGEGVGQHGAHQRAEIAGAIVAAG